MPALHTLLWPLSLGRTEYITEGGGSPKEDGCSSKRGTAGAEKSQDQHNLLQSREASLNSGGARSQGNTRKSHVGVPFPLSRKTNKVTPPTTSTPHLPDRRHAPRTSVPCRCFPTYRPPAGNKLPSEASSQGRAGSCHLTFSERASETRQ